MLDKFSLKLRQAMPLEDKIRFTQRRIHEWVNEFGEDGVYVSFSGGKDSTVLLDIVRNLYPTIEAVYVDTGLEYPEIRQFVKTFDNVTILRPKKSFKEVIEQYGFPIVSKEVSEFVSNARKCIESNYTKYLAHYQRLMGTAKDKKGNISPYCCPKWKFLLDAPFKISNRCCLVMKKHLYTNIIKIRGKYPLLVLWQKKADEEHNSI